MSIRGIEDGVILKNNDPRYRGQRVKVVSVVGDYAVYRSRLRITRIRLDRIYTDGKHRHQGWSLVK